MGDPAVQLCRADLLTGDATSGEHAAGRAKAHYFTELEDPAKLALLRRIKDSSDPAGILNPGVVFV